MVSATSRVDADPGAGGLAPADDACAFERAVPAARAGWDAQRWARAVYEDAPPLLRTVVAAGWRFGLGFRLGPSGAPDHVLGARITHREPDSLTLELRSRLLVSRNVFTVRDGRVRWTTVVRYTAPGAGWLWRPAAAIHHVLARRLLDTAAGRRTSLVRTVLRAAPVFNAPLAALVRSGRLRGGFTVVTYTGRRSGRTISTPVNYRRSGASVRIGVLGAEHKTWWRNFEGPGAPVTLTLDGAPRAGHGVVERDGRGRVSVVVTLDG